eukprot:jgi/Tetstr1/429386/TSEL_019300.t1
MHAVPKACKHGDGGPALSWPSFYAYMQRYHRAFLVSRELSMFDHWFPWLQAKRMDLLGEGAQNPPAPGRLNPIPALWGPKACA